MFVFFGGDDRVRVFLGVLARSMVDTNLVGEPGSGRAG